MIPHSTAPIILYLQTRLHPLDFHCPIYDQKLQKLYSSNTFAYGHMQTQCSI